MYQFSYAEIQTDSVADAKDRERQLLTRSIDLLCAARDTGADSLERTEAVHFLTRIWTTFIQDLGSEDLTFVDQNSLAFANPITSVPTG